jgi:2-polyprenyl-3-methyl-5-hydroxy-6-metoxy-1,4-benzoquinol methylase
MFKNHPLHVQTFAILVQVATVIIEHVKSSERFVKEHVKLIDPSFTLLDSKIEPLEFLFNNFF